VRWAGIVPGQQEGCGHAHAGGEGDEVGDDQVALHTHHEDHEGDHRLEGTETHQNTEQLKRKRLKMAAFPTTPGI